MYVHVCSKFKYVQSCSSCLGLCEESAIAPAENKGYPFYGAFQQNLGCFHGTRLGSPCLWPAVRAAIAGRPFQALIAFLCFRLHYTTSSCTLVYCDTRRRNSIDSKAAWLCRHRSSRRCWNLELRSLQSRLRNCSELCSTFMTRLARRAWSRAAPCSCGGTKTRGMSMRSESFETFHNEDTSKAKEIQDTSPTSVSHSSWPVPCSVWSAGPGERGDLHQKKLLRPTALKGNIQDTLFHHFYILYPVYGSISTS